MQRVPYVSDENMHLCKYNEEFALWLQRGTKPHAAILYTYYQKHPPYVASVVRCLHGAMLYGIFREWQADPTSSVDNYLSD